MKTLLWLKVTSRFNPCAVYNYIYKYHKEKYLLWWAKMFERHWLKSISKTIKVHVVSSFSPTRWTVFLNFCIFYYLALKIILPCIHMEPSGEGNCNPSSTLAWKIPWMEEPGRQSMGSLWVRHDWATSLSLFTFMHWRRKWQPTPVFLPRESQGPGSLVGCHLWGCTESDATETT